MRPGTLKSLVAEMADKSTAEILAEAAVRGIGAKPNSVRSLRSEVKRLRIAPVVPTAVPEHLILERICRELLRLPRPAQFRALAYLVARTCDVGSNEVSEALYALAREVRADGGEQ